MARRRSGGRYKMTAKRRAALKKAQLVSARKRRAAPNKKKSNTRRNVAIGVTAVVGLGAVAGAGAAGVARHRMSGSTVKMVSGNKTAPFSVKRTHIAGGRGTQFTVKRGSKTLYYHHKSIKVPKGVAGTKATTSMPAYYSGYLKYRGGHEVLPVSEFMRKVVG